MVDVLFIEVFKDPGALVDFVNDEGILQAKIQTIKERAGKWYLFYWAVP